MSLAKRPSAKRKSPGRAGGAVGIAAFRALAEALPIGVLLVDSGLELLAWSPASLGALAAPDAASLRDRWREACDQIDASGARDAVARGEERFVQVRIGAPPTVAAIKLRPIADEQGLVLVLAEGANLAAEPTELALAGIARVNAYVSAALLHDINAPLNNFKLTLALFDATLARNGDAGTATDARWQRYLKVLRDESTRLGTLLEDVRRICEIAPARADRFDLRAVVADLGRLLRHEATIRDIRLATEVPATPLHVNADAALVRLAALGLAIHWLECTAQRGNLSIALAGAEGRAELAIASDAPDGLDDTLRGFEAVGGDVAFRHVGIVAARSALARFDGRVHLEARADGSARFLLALPLAA